MGNYNCKIPNFQGFYGAENPHPLADEGGICERGASVAPDTGREVRTV